VSEKKMNCLYLKAKNLLCIGTFFCIRSSFFVCFLCRWELISVEGCLSCVKNYILQCCRELSLYSITRFWYDIYVIITWCFLLMFLSHDLVHSSALNTPKVVNCELPFTFQHCYLKTAMRINGRIWHTCRILTVDASLQLSGN
jgi:hypothetical protein